MSRMKKLMSLLAISTIVVVATGGGGSQTANAEVKAKIIRVTFNQFRDLPIV